MNVYNEHVTDGIAVATDEKEEEVMRETGTLMQQILKVNVIMCSSKKLAFELSSFIRTPPEVIKLS